MPASSARKLSRAPSKRRPPPRDLRIVSPQKRKATVQPSTDTNAQQYAPCRVLGHSWQHVGRADVSDAPSGANGTIGYVSTCSHCGMRRVRWFTRSGMIGHSPTYTPPEGYARRGDEVLSLQEWRRTWLTGLGID